MDLPGDIEQYKGSYMAFFVNGKETNVFLDPEFRNRYACSVQTGGSAIGKLSFALVLDSGTALKIYFTTKNAFEGTPDVSVQGGETFAAEWRDGRYVVAIDNLAAHQLADGYDVSIIADGECKLRISALSYANMALQNSSDDDEKNAMASQKPIFDFQCPVSEPASPAGRLRQGITGRGKAFCIRFSSPWSGNGGSRG